MKKLTEKAIIDVAKGKLYIHSSQSKIREVFNKDVLKSLPEKLKQEEIIEVVNTYFKKELQRKQNKIPSQSLRKQLTESRINKLSVWFKTVFNWNYRSPSSSWVNQNNTYNVVFSLDRSCDLSVLVRTVYHHKHNWKANELYAVLLIPNTTKKSQIKNIAGMLTVFSSKYSAVWFSQGKGFNINTHSGWCIADTHIEKSEKIKTLANAIKFYKAEKLKQLKKQAKLENKLNSLVSVDTSLKAGNCMTGTINFKNKHFPDKDVVTLKEVIEKEDSVFTRRLLAVV